MKAIIKKFVKPKGSDQVRCACCRTKLTYGYVLDTNEVIDGFCKSALDIIAKTPVVTAMQSIPLRINKHQVEFFGGVYIESPPMPLHIPTQEELAEMDRQAEQDALDLFG